MNNMRRLINLMEGVTAVPGLNEKSTSEKQARTMAAAAHDPKFAKKVGISQTVAKDFNKADTGTKQLSNAMKESSEYSTDPVNTIRSVISQLHPGDTSPDAIAAEVPNLASNPAFLDWCKQANDFYYGVGSGDFEDSDYTDDTMHRGEMGDYSRDLVPEGEDDAFSADPGHEFYTGDEGMDMPVDQEVIDTALQTFQSLVDSGIARDVAMEEAMEKATELGATEDEMACIHDAIAEHGAGDEIADTFDPSTAGLGNSPTDASSQPLDGAEFIPDPGEDEFNFEESYDFNNGYGDIKNASGNDYFPNGADSPVVKTTGPSGSRQGDNPEQKKMQVAEVHKELVYGYRSFLRESKKK